MAKKLTPYQKQIQALTKTYQASIASAGPEYEKAFAAKQQKLSAYNDQLSSYQQRLDQYNTKLQESIKSRLSFSDGLDEYPNRDWKRGISYYVEGVGRVLPASLEAKGWEVIGNNQVGLVEIRKPRPAPFTEKEPAKPDFSASEQEIESIQANRQGAKQTLEREITERRSSRLRAVTQGSRERPMLSKGVTLNG